MNSKGFTLIELMIVIGIIGILATIGYPSYQKKVIETRRVNATACLTEISQWMERYYTTHMTYEHAEITTRQCLSDLGDHYTFEFIDAPSANTFNIGAIAIGMQASGDSACSTLTIDQNSSRSPTECWKG